MTKTAQIGTFKRSNRGFGMREFKDSSDHECSVQCSSAIDFDFHGGLKNPGTSYLFVGVADVKPKVMAGHAKKVGVDTAETVGWVEYPIPREVLLSARMHLNRRQVRNLVKTLNQWLRTGNLEDEPAA